MCSWHGFVIVMVRCLYGVGAIWYSADRVLVWNRQGAGMVLVQCSRVVTISQHRVLFTCMSHEDTETHSLATLMLGSFHFTERSIAKIPFIGKLLKVSVNFNKSSCKSWTANVT